MILRKRNSRQLQGCSNVFRYYCGVWSDTMEYGSAHLQIWTYGWGKTMPCLHDICDKALIQNTVAAWVGSWKLKQICLSVTMGARAGEIQTKLQRIDSKGISRTEEGGCWSNKVEVLVPLVLGAHNVDFLRSAPWVNRLLKHLSHLWKCGVCGVMACVAYLSFSRLYQIVTRMTFTHGAIIGSELSIDATLSKPTSSWNKLEVRCSTDSPGSCAVCLLLLTFGRS